MSGQALTRTPIEDLLARAAEDWLHPSEILGVARRSGISDPAALRDLAIGLLARLISDGLVVLGDVGDEHVPWDCAPGDAILRVAREWGKRDDPYVMPGELFWVNATAAGQQLGEAVWAREAGN